MNTSIYQFVAFVLQASKAHNVTVDGGAKYSVPSGEFAIDESTFGAFLSDVPPSRDLTSYALTAISGADNFNDDETTIGDVFNLIVNNTREVTPTCRFPLFAHIYSSYLPVPNQVGTIWNLGYAQKEVFSEGMF